jgi:hypothetical protein
LNTNNKYNCYLQVFLGGRLETHIPDTVVNQMYESPVQDLHCHQQNQVINILQIMNAKVTFSLKGRLQTHIPEKGTRVLFRPLQGMHGLNRTVLRRDSAALKCAGLIQKHSACHWQPVQTHVNLSILQIQVASIVQLKK